MICFEISVPDWCYDLIPELETLDFYRFPIIVTQTVSLGANG